MATRGCTTCEANPLSWMVVQLVPTRTLTSRYPEMETLLETDKQSETLPLFRLELKAIRLDSSVQLLFGPEEEFDLRIERPFLLTLATGQSVHVRFMPFADNQPEGITALSRLVTRSVRHATANVDGTLKLEFDNGTRLYAPHGDGFEAWTLAGHGYLRISLPSGGLA
jgi:hypothetical protein